VGVRARVHSWVVYIGECVCDGGRWERGWGAECREGKIRGETGQGMDGRQDARYKSVDGLNGLLGLLKDRKAFCCA